MRVVLAAVATICSAAWVCGLAAASTAPYAPADRPGPALAIPAATLAGAVRCSGDLRDAGRAPVLLSPGTGGTPEENYGWNYMPALSARGIPWCALATPDHTLADIQDDGEYFAYAIRMMHARSGRKVSIVGYSQGGMNFRWALRFWPDLRPMVDDVIGLAPPNHGTAATEQLGACARACPAAAWQHLPGSRFLHALNSLAETFAGISYTQVYTRYDVLSTPPGHQGTSPLHSGKGTIANVLIQDVCPGSTADHATIGTTDAVGWALVIDALEHPGAASPARIDGDVCTQAALPGVQPTAAPQAVTAVPYLLAAVTPFNFVGIEKLRAEPPLRCYVFADCPQTRRLPRVSGRLAGTSLRPTLTLTVMARAGEPALRMVRIVLPRGLSVARGARRRLQTHTGRRPGGATIAATQRTITLRARPEPARRISLRALAGALRPARARPMVLRVETADGLGLSATIRIKLRPRLGSATAGGPARHRARTPAASSAAIKSASMR